MNPILAQVLSVAMSLIVSNPIHQFFIQRAIDGAGRVGLQGGLGIGATAAGAVARPGLAFNLVTLPFRLLNAPFYSLRGNYRRNLELDRLAAGARAAFDVIFNNLKEKHVNFNMGGIVVYFSRSYIDNFEQQFEATKNLSAIKNPQLPPFILIGVIKDPFGISRMVISLDNRAVCVLTLVVLTGLTLIFIKVFIFVARRCIKYALKGYLSTKEFVRSEMRQADFKKQLSKDKSKKESFYSDRNMIDTSIESR